MLVVDNYSEVVQ